MYTLPKKIMQSTLNTRSASSTSNYVAALKALHNLQSNTEYLKLATKNNSKTLAACKLLDTKKYLVRTGVTLEKLDSLSVIHVAGTKGKGSTCAYVEAILREHGFRTGFYSSPHLVSVRERIRINGQPLGQTCFSQYLLRIHKKLEDAKDDEHDMPTYFKFLTILMFNIFLDEKIDVAIIEVGIGGLYDCTNIVTNPVCVGITSLGLDHTSLLGDTIEDIAYQKSGIFKPRTVAFSVPQLPKAMDILQKRATEVNCELRIAPAFEKYKWQNLSPILRTSNVPQQQNASLAIQIATEWMVQAGKTGECSATISGSKENRLSTGCDSGKYNSVFEDKVAIGLSSCKWPGRMQTLSTSVGVFFLDGAHTIESMEYCISWFDDASRMCNIKRFLIFNMSGTRDPIKLLMPLKSLDFCKSYFVPNYAGIASLDDDMNSTFSMMDEQKAKCETNSKIWGANSMVANSVLEVLQDIKKLKQESSYHDRKRFHILVTGSLHLVGATLAILDPNLTMTTQF